MCRFPYCDCAKLSAEERAEWERRRDERAAYHKEWTDRAQAEREAKPAADDDLDDVAARLPALERLQRDLAYRTPESHKPLAYLVLTYAQGVELLALCTGKAAE
jgi:flagellar motility protein MotE (MotC chaperone)